MLLLFASDNVRYFYTFAIRHKLSVKTVSEVCCYRTHELRKVLFFGAVDDFCFFVCESHISGICAKFTGKTCLIPRSEEFECQGPWSKVKIAGTKNAMCTPITLGSDGMERARCKCHAAAGGTIPSLPGLISAAYVRFMFGKTSLALVLIWIVCVF